MKFIFVLYLFLLAGIISINAQVSPDSLYSEAYRSQYYFSPQKGWIGDPCGFIYYQGKYHMYWWGKVESTDASNTFGFNLCVGDGRKVIISYDTDSHNLVIDRTYCADVDIPKFCRMTHAWMLKSIWK